MWEGPARERKGRDRRSSRARTEGAGTRRGSLWLLCAAVAAPARAPGLSRGGGPSRRGPRPPLSAGQPGGAPKACADSVL
ncbi:hypothetical protein ACRRTK_020470 [Alexandromys fortis]